ncbi:DinB family protein [Paenibacillus humicola]|uniref:DinB family protein n=1 Tax=Paenibacillus humicola TaxID=3110540 RepID=UPI00237C1B19|nr:DinB family protein [Paenibacillus humicola]
MELRPQAGAYAPYLERYISLVPEGSLTAILETQRSAMLALLEPVTEEQAGFCYAEGKWSVKDVLGHVTDNERIWAYRLLRAARGDGYSYPGYEQDDYVRTARFDRLPFKDLLEEFAMVRRSTILLLKGLPDEAWARKGWMYGEPLSALAAACVIAGHERHHWNVLKERYFPLPPS